MQDSLDSALDAQGLSSEQVGLLDLIDKLQFARLDNVKLPQIVVVGDQSAGKSSVLEAITGTPFPRDAGACTRFATEIRLRRSAQASLDVSILPDKNRGLGEQEKLRRFGGTVDSDTSFEALMRAAVELIAPKNIPGRFAARDILIVEKRGPDMPLLTLVDLPGLVRNANNDQSLEDIKTIEALSDRYMRSPRTIILAVVGGNSDYVQAPILTKTRRFDPDGSRTIGVLTKPDLTESIGLQDKFIELVNNRDRRNHFRLGWYVLLNPGPREPGQPWPGPDERRQIESSFFGRGAWSSLPQSVCGAASLKQKLSTQLQRHIGRHVKTLRRQIQKSLDNCETELAALGNGRDTPDEMRIDLVELFSTSKELVIPAVYGFYKNPPKKSFFRVTADPRGTPAQNLRARAIEENDRFAARIRAHGRRFNFSSSSAPGGTHASGDDVDAATTGKQDYARQEVEMLLRQVRGSEFPMDPKPRAVYMLFQSYSESWPQLAREHKDNLGAVCNEFLGELIDYAWPKRMREPLRREFLDPQMRALMDKAVRELDLLTQDMNLEVQPYDPEYEERLRTWHLETTREGGTFSEAQEVLEKMLIYYELSAKNFIRNVITQVIERHLLQGMYGLFNSVEVLAMSNQAIEAIAAENKETRERRQVLKTQKKAIEEAKDICTSLAMRKEIRAYAEEGTEDDTAESSDEEGPQKRSSVGPGPPRQPVSPIQRRASRQPRDGRNNAYRGEDIANSATRASGYPTPPVATGILPGPGSYPAPAPTAETDRSPAGQTEDFYSASPRQPLQAPPPPPPRPSKVRTESQGQGQAAPTRVSQSGTPYYGAGGAPERSNSYIPEDPRGAMADSATYGQRTHPRNIIGRA